MTAAAKTLRSPTPIWSPGFRPRPFPRRQNEAQQAQSGKAAEEKIAKPLKLDLLEAADGVLKIINAKMEEAIKAVSSARGYDIRDFTLVAFGGGGPMHAGGRR